MQLKDIATKDVTYVKPDSLLVEAAKLMARKKISSILAVEDGVPVGIISERDFVRIYIEGKDYSKAVVRDVMSSPVITADVSMSLEDAMDMVMREGIRRLPVTSNGKIEGIITETDIVKAMRAQPSISATLVRRLKFTKT